MGMAGAPFPYYITYIEPSSAFGLAYAVNSIAMPMIGGTGTWIGPLVGAHPARLDPGDRARHHLVRRQPADRRRAAGRLRDHRAERAGRAGAGPPASRGGGHERSAAAGFRRRQALRRLRRARRHRSRRRAGRAPRPDRTERLGQVHAGELHLRHAAERDRRRDLRRAQDGRPAGAPAHHSRAGPLVPAAAAVPLALGRRQPAHSAALRREGPARPGDLREPSSMRTASNICGWSGSTTSPPSSRAT